MCLTTGASDGRNVTASSRDFPCQNSASLLSLNPSDSFYFRNLSSVPMQKYEVTKRTILSSKHSLVKIKSGQRTP